jgi:hypothetical protein
MLKVVEATEAAQKEMPPLDTIAREGARKMLVMALDAEVDAYIGQEAGEWDE